MAADPVVIGVAGGSGSGKTTVVTALLDRVGRERVALVTHDNYYRDLPMLSLEERAAQNFDHPDAFESALTAEHIEGLIAGKTINMPTYDFEEHRRTTETVAVEPRPVVIVDGFMIFATPELRRLMDIRVFVDAPSDMRLIRRMRRDVAERGRTVEGVLNQYETTVRPMHQEFVEPSKRHANVIIPHGGHNQIGIDMIASRIEAALIANPIVLD